MNERELASCIDQTLLSATVTSEQIKQLCLDAKSYEFHAVCVNGRWVALAAELLSDSKISVAGGATPEDIKLFEEMAPRCKIKAAGGIRTAEQALIMLEAGAHRIGTSSGVQIMEEFKVGR